MPPPGTRECDIAIVGAGAAGLFAAIHAARTAPPTARVLALDGARKLGAKVLVAGGGRCNVTHHRVDEHDYAGSSPHAIRKVLRRFPVDDTVAFFRERGVELKREETGKLFPASDDARSVLNALLDAARDARAEILHPWRVASIARGQGPHPFEILPDPSSSPDPPAVRARRLILATGGLALPRSGSDGAGLRFAQSLGHSITPHVFPALVPLTLPRDHPLCELSGVACPARLDLLSPTGKVLRSTSNAVLFTHFGLSGPATLDISRHWILASRQGPGVALALAVLPEPPSELDAALVSARGGAAGGHSPRRYLQERGLPERLARVVLTLADIPAGAVIAALTREQRRALVQACTRLPLPVTGDRGFTFAEVTAGGVPLAELDLGGMQSRACPGLFLCGEICDVDGRLGGFNFQWAWASGFVAGSAAARDLAGEALP